MWIGRVGAVAVLLVSSVAAAQGPVLIVIIPRAAPTGGGGGGGGGSFPLRGGHNSSLMLDTDQSLRLLADARLSPDTRLAVEKELLAAGREAIPTLVQRASHPPRLASDPDLRAVSQQMLFKLLLPGRKGSQALAVNDWEGWWSGRERMTLKALRAEMGEALERSKRAVAQADAFEHN